MNFFEHQEKSKRNTAVLVALFSLAVTLIILAVYFVVMVVFFSSSADPGSTGSQPEIFITVGLGVLMIIFGGSLFKSMALRRGGPYIAENLGGRRVNPATSDPDEKKFINVVEEMAIAAGIPVPVAYVLENERGINAFAAGYTPDDAVVAVTDGCLRRLTRDELQGVVAHEFSHILNGDMRLNIRLIAMISGILVIASIGRLALRPGIRTRKNDLPFMLAGLALVIIGYAGVVVSRMIQSAVSRQREYLADASAVQFTRNPPGIAGALKKIGGFAGGSRIKTPRAEEASHMFFSMAIRSIFATHPPIKQRIQRIDPSFDGNLPSVPEDAPPIAREAAAAMEFGGSESRSPVTPQRFSKNAGLMDAGHMKHSLELLATVPDIIRQEIKDPMGASAVVFALLLVADPAEREHQLKSLEKIVPDAMRHHVSLMYDTLVGLDTSLKLPLLDLSIPALRQLSASQLETFKKAVDALVASDGRLSLFEYALQLIVSSRLDNASHPAAGKVKFKSLEPLTDDAVVLISKLTIEGHGSSADAENAFLSAIRQLPMLADIPEGSARAPRMENHSFERVGKALVNFSAASPGVKKTILDTCAYCVLFDQTVTTREAELLRAVAYVLGLPVPPVLLPKKI